LLPTLDAESSLRIIVIKEQIKILSNENKDKKVKLGEMKIKLNSFQRLIDEVGAKLNDLG